VAAPVLVVVNGPPGVGKSTVARGLGDRLGLEVISKDRLKERLYLKAAAYGREGVEASRRFGGEAFELLFRRARRERRGGRSLIVDAPFEPARHDPRFWRLAADVRVRLIQVWVHAPVEMVRRRRLRRLGTRHATHHGMDASEARASIARGLERRLGIEPTVEVDAASRADLDEVRDRLEASLVGERWGASSCTIGSR
jgi:predicted kinase